MIRYKTYSSIFVYVNVADDKYLIVYWLWEQHSLTFSFADEHSLYRSISWPAVWLRSALKVCPQENYKGL